MKIDDKMFLVPLFSALERADIRYAVMRNAETLPFDLGDGDIDVLVHPKDFIRGVILIKHVVQLVGGRVVAETHSPAFCQMELAGFENGSWWGLCLDLFSEIRYRGSVKLVDDSIFTRRIQTVHKIWTFPEDIGGLLGFLKELLYNGKFTERYAGLAQQALANKASLSSISCLNKESIMLLSQILQQGAFSASRASSIKRTILRHAFCLNPWDYIWRRCAFLKARITRIFKPSGRMVAVLGTDGAGKSTLLSAALPLLIKVTHRSLVVHHLKPDLLPPLAKWRGGHARSAGPVKNPHGSKPSGFLGSSFRIAYLVADYLAGYWVKVFPLLIKVPPAIYVFDRYAYDMLFDGRRLRIALPAWIIRMALSIVPRPDLIICLGGDPEQLVARKEELSLDEVKRQVMALQVWAERDPNAVFISTTQPLDQTVDLFLRALLLGSSEKHA